MRTSAIPAVYPAGPNALASHSDIPAGTLVIQPPFTRAYAEQPPSCETPTYSPLAVSTASPFAKRGSVDDTTVPEKSIPPMHEGRRRILPLPVAASASL